MTLRSSNQRTPATLFALTEKLPIERLVVAEVAVGETEHQAIADAVDGCAGAALLQARTRGCRPDTAA